MNDRRVSYERLLTDIYQIAEASVGLRVDPGSDAITLFRLVLAEVRGLIAARNEIDERAVALLKVHPDDQLLTSTPGIGRIADTVLAMSIGIGSGARVEAQGSRARL